MAAWDELRQRVMSTSQIRDVDRRAIEDFGMHSLVLMENAARGCVDWIRKHIVATETQSPMRGLILCGRGNNGGDGLVIARHLRLLGWEVEVWVWGPIESMSADAQHNLQILLNDCPEVIRVVAEDEDFTTEPEESKRDRYDLIVDAMLGTGASGNPREPLASWIRHANDLSGLKVAIDIPTGVDAETGETGTPAFTPSATLTFVALKPAMGTVLPPGSGSQRHALFGEVEVLPIGIPQRQVIELLRTAAG